jgi:DNA polymerase III alpha subunit
MIAYWCAFCKLFFPAEFICANLTYGSDGKKEELVKEAKRIGLKVVLPKVGISDAFQWVVKENNIYVPFIEVKGVGQKTAEEFAKIKKKKNSGFFDLGDKPSGKMGKVIEEIGANGSEPTGDLQKYFSFDISDINN